MVGWGGSDGFWGVAIGLADTPLSPETSSIAIRGFMGGVVTVGLCVIVRGSGGWESSSAWIRFSAE